MRIFYNKTVDLLVRRLVPGVVAVAIAGGGILLGGAELEDVPGLIDAEAAELSTDTSSTTASTTSTDSSSSDSSDISSDSFTDGTYQDGVWTGTAAGFGGNITVEVTISGGEITAIEIVSASGETASYLAKAEAVIDKIIAAQSPNVDTVSGATYSSNGIINAVKRALTKAMGGTVDEDDDTSTSSSTSSSSSSLTTVTYTDPSAYNDGTYTGTAEGFGGDITVQVTISDGKIVSIAIVSAEYETASYLAKAEAVIDSILAAQSPNVDTISGATYSSNGIINAVKKALSKAAATSSSTEDDDTENDDNTADDDTNSDDNANSGDDSTAQDDENTTYEDIVYTASATCEPDEYEDFDAYALEISVTVRETTRTETVDGVTTTTVTREITNLEVTDPDSTSDNWTYINWAVAGRGSSTGLCAQAVSAQSFDGLDAVTRATCSSTAIITAGQTLDLQLGTTTTTEETTEEAAD